SVSAEASADVNPDKAELVFGVVSRGTDPAAIQADNDASVRNIINAVQAMGVPAGNIKTVGYSLDRWTEWNDTLRTSVDMGYVLTNQVRVVTYNVSQAGGILKAAVSGGANSVDSVSFGLSDALQQKTYNGLLGTAAGQADDKAKAMASAAGVSLGKLQYMNEGYSYAQPLSNYNYRSMAAGASAAAPMPATVTPGLAKVTADVTASYAVN
ncbi:MAG: SIMPL domain-containing protein, partial [Candidatus Micrarchaeota archaeon]|nr:SIMPL domain-containing protein [Candidatus Micrarchaeota archaeon]